MKIEYSVGSGGIDRRLCGAGVVRGEVDEVVRWWIGSGQKAGEEWIEGRLRRAGVGAGGG